mgnify:CR=1 FL=1
MKKSDELYYHAGVRFWSYSLCEFVDLWSKHTRLTRKTAVLEAKRMCKKYTDARPMVECWAKKHGLRPRCADAVISCKWVD